MPNPVLLGARAAHRRTPEPKREIKVSPLPVTTASRQYQEVRSRYKDLHISSDFVKMVTRWVEYPALHHEQLMQNPPKINFSPDFAMPVCPCF